MHDFEISTEQSVLFDVLKGRGSAAEALRRLTFRGTADPGERGQLDGLTEPVADGPWRQRERPCHGCRVVFPVRVDVPATVAER